MTKAFVTMWKQKRGCKACLRIPGRGMCASCLVQARISWHKYVGERVTKGLCIQCPRKRKPGEQRCRACAEENRANCLGWYYRVGKVRVQKCHQDGVCLSCKKVRAAPHHVYCIKCLNRRRDVAAGMVVQKRPYKFLSLPLDSRKE